MTTRKNNQNLSKGESRGHLKVRRILNEADFTFVEEKQYANLLTSTGRPLRFDFMVYDEDGQEDFAIEFNGIQHYEPVPFFGGQKAFSRQQYNDNRKREYCRSQGITLVEIPYTDLEIFDIGYIMKKAYPFL